MLGLADPARELFRPTAPAGGAIGHEPRGDQRNRDGAEADGDGTAVRQKSCGPPDRPVASSAPPAASAATLTRW